MRKAASLAFAVPELEVDISHDDELLVRVERRLDAHDLPGGATLLSPCAFRGAVGRATAHARSGGRALFLGLANDADPDVSYHMPFSGATRPLGIIVARVGTTVVHVFATTVGRARVEATTRALHPAGATLDAVAVCTARDPVTETTLVYCETPLGVLAHCRPAIERTMEMLLVSVGADEIVDTVTPVRGATEAHDGEPHGRWGVGHS
jgi:hypothetical protein